jgi:hypothetical protein
MRKGFLLAGVLVGAFSSVVTPLHAQTWQSYAADNNGGAGGEYWDNASADGASCNIGYIASGTSLVCNNQVVAGWLPYTGPAMTNNLRTVNASSPFMFAAGTYRLRQNVGLGGQVAALDQPFGYFTRDGAGNAMTTTLPSTNAFDITVTFSSAWGLFIDEVGHGMAFSDVAANPFFALFGSRAAGLSTAGGITTVLAQNGDHYLAGYADVVNGDKDFNDEVLLISAVPEPSTYALLATGMVGLLVLRHRRRRAV